MQAPIPVQPIRRRLLRELVHDQLAEAIVTGYWAPGEHLDLDELEAFVGTSRTPVRQAVAQLADIGLVEVRPQSHTRVAPIDPRAIAHRLEMLGALHVAAIRRPVASLSDADLDRLDDAVRRVEGGGDQCARGNAATEFFAVYRGVVSNETFERIRGRVYPHIRRALHLMHGHFDFGVDAHLLRRIEQATRAGDHASAADAASEYFTAFVNTLMPDESAASFPRTTLDGSVRRVERRLLSEDAFAGLLAAITGGSLAPGSAIRDGEVAELFGVSRAPVRDAIARLAEIGLVEVSPYRHTRVVGVTPEALDEALFISGALLGHAVPRAVPRFEAADVELLEGHAAEAARCLAGGDAVGFGRCVQAFFTAFSSPAGNTEIVDAIGSVTPLFRCHLLDSEDGGERLMALVDGLLDAARLADGVHAQVLLDAFHNLPADDRLADSAG